MKNLFYSALALSTLILASCSQDDNANQNAGGDNPTIEIPSSYTFSRAGESTVSFSGQTTRIAMAQEILSAFRDFDNSTQASLDAMFAHVEGNDDFSTASLNDSDKSVRSKVAASFDFFGANTAASADIKADFDGFIFNQINDVLPNNNTAAQPGIAGQIADGTSTRYITANGVELNQFFAKGLIGALMTDQILNNYLSTAVLDEADNIDTNDNDITEDGKSYTTMEHKWDEAYGYLYGASVDPANPNATIGDDDSFLNEYTGRVASDPDFAGIASTIFDAYKLGRAAIVAKEYTIRDAQAAILRQKISEVIAVRGIYYLQQGKTAIEAEDFGGAFHDLSEALGFIYSLQFTRQPESNAPFFTRAEVTSLIDSMFASGDNGLWDITPETLQTISETIASKFSFTVEQAGSTE